MTGGYTKLFSSIITSTIWQEDNPTRILWITMLALSDMDGKVEGSIPGLAKMAGITIAECEISLQKLMSPDPYSRTKEHEGRRVLEVDGGWLLLNRAKYRDKRDPEKRREQTRDAVRRYRERHHVSQNVSQCKPMKAQEEEEEEKEKEIKKEEEEEELPSFNTISEFETQQSRPEPEEVKRYAQEIGYPDLNVEKFMDDHDTVGWKKNGQPITDWRARVRAYKRNRQYDKRAGTADFDMEAAKKEAEKYYK